MMPRRFLDDVAVAVGNVALAVLRERQGLRVSFLLRLGWSLLLVFLVVDDNDFLGDMNRLRDNHLMVLRLSLGTRCNILHDW